MTTRQELLLWLAVTTVAIVALGFAIATFLDATDQPETGPVVRSVGQAASVVQIEQLLPYGRVEWGLHKVQVDGRTFLLWVKASGAAIVEYEPKAEATP